ncbi:MAG TPA: hypothetical protein VF600_00400 [Abditibacteriaceae bacterium]
MRGALMYARQHWWLALWVAFIAARAVYLFVVKADARLLLGASLCALILTFWWICVPASQRGEVFPLIGFFSAMTFSATKPDFVFLLCLTGLMMAWPWVQRIKTPRNFLTWLVGGTAAFIVIFFTVLFTFG